jgi:hypothetical protein
MSIVLILYSLVGDPALNPLVGPSYIFKVLETLVTKTVLEKYLSS